MFPWLFLLFCQCKLLSYTLYFIAVLWIRIRFRIRIDQPWSLLAGSGPLWECGSGFRRVKIIHKKENVPYILVYNARCPAIFWGPEASPVALSPSWKPRDEVLYYLRFRQIFSTAVPYSYSVVDAFNPRFNLLVKATGNSIWNQVHYRHKLGRSIFPYSYF